MIKGSKKMLTIILFVIFLLALTTCVVINLPQFGKLPSGARLERIKRSPQWKEHRTYAETLSTGAGLWLRHQNPEARIYEILDFHVEGAMLYFRAKKR